MSIWDHFIKLRADLPVWVWPLLLYELWCVKVWALDEAERRGLDQIAMIISVDDWGRVHVHFVTEDARPAHPLERLGPFALPVSLALDAARPLPAQIGLVFCRHVPCPLASVWAGTVPGFPDTS